MAGSELVADGLTKPLQGQSFAKFVNRLGMISQAEPRARRAGVQVKRMERRLEKVILWLALVGCSLLAVDGVLGGLLVAAAAIVKWKREGQNQNQEREESKTSAGWTNSAREDYGPTRG